MPAVKRAASSEVYGPLDASYHITFEGSGGSTSVYSAESVRSNLAYFARQGRTDRTHVIMIEHCPVRGCNGDGTRSVKKRGNIFLTEVPCVGCRGRHETELDVVALTPTHELGGRAVETMSLTDVLRELGYTHEPAEFGRRVVLRNGWPVFQGIANAVWIWLRETGQIL